MIPANVWQLYVSINGKEPLGSRSEAIKLAKICPTHSASWLPVDGGWTYTFLGTEAGRAFVVDHFGDQPDIIEVYNSLNLPVMLSDFLRYLVLAAKGGIYADNDVELVQPPTRWVPQRYRHDARIMVGIEMDKPVQPGSNEWKLQFVQHTLIAAPGHPIMRRMVRLIVESLLWISRERNQPISDLQLHDLDVVKITGPRAFTRVVFDHLSEQIGCPVDYRGVSQIKEPKLLGDTLIVPNNYFAAGQAHSGSDGQSPDKLVQHYWKGSWRHWDQSLSEA